MSVSDTWGDPAPLQEIWDRLTCPVGAHFSAWVGSLHFLDLWLWMKTQYLGQYARTDRCLRPGPTAST